MRPAIGIASVGLSDLRSSGGKLAASPGAAIATLLAGVVIGGTGFFRFAGEAASRNNELMLEAAQRGGHVSGAMSVGATMLSPLAFALGTPLGLLATYLTLTGLVRSVAAAVGEPRHDPLLALLTSALRRLERRRIALRETRARTILEGPDVPDRLGSPARLGIEGADLVVIASRRKPDWTPGTVLDCDGRWFRVGEAVERSFAVGLRTLYPLVEAKESEVFRRVVPYVLPPVPPTG